MAAGATLTLTASNLLPTHTVCAFGGDGSDDAPPDADPTVATVSSVASARCAAPRAASPLLTTVRLEQPRADGAVAATAALPLSIFGAPALDAGTSHAAAVGDAAPLPLTGRGFFERRGGANLRCRYRRLLPGALPPPNAPAAAAAAAILAVHTLSLIHI